MIPNYIPLNPIPEEISNAARTLHVYFEKQGLREWEFSYVADRRLVIKLERELNEANKELHQKYIEFDALFNEAEQIRIERDAALAANAELLERLSEAEELIREIRDDEVNAQDETDKFLRDHKPSELAKMRADNAELLERLRERTESHLAASARDVQTIQQQAVEIDRLKNILNHGQH
jgi:hypothetical protein